MKEKIEILRLSVRSKNCLKQENINYIDDLVVLSESDLKRIPNMGVKSLNEIKEKLKEIELGLGMNIDYYIGNESHYSVKEPEINIWLSDISNYQFKKAKLETFVLCAIESLSIRSKNSLNLKLECHNSIIVFLKYLFSLQSVLILPNIGKTSELEIQDFLKNIHQYIKCLYQSKKIVIETAIDLMECMSISQCLIDRYVENYSDNIIRFFAIIDLVIKDNLSEKELEVLKYRKGYWNEKQQITLEKIGEKLGITRERVRQIEEKADKKLWSIIKGLSTYSSLINVKQLYELDDYFINNIAIINKRDKTNFSDDFLYRILSIFLQDDYKLMFKSGHKYKFLIKKNIDNVFDFVGFIDKIKSLTGKSNIDYFMDFNGLLYPYFRQVNNNINTDKIISICEDLLNLELGVILDVNNQILIKSKNEKSVSLYAEEILIQANKPMHLDTIYSQIKKNYPKFNKSKKYMGNAFVGNNKFIFFDRNSTYGLKSWEGELTLNSVLIDTVKSNKTNIERSSVKVWSENEKIIVKGGTIIDIVIELLKQFKEPQHINNIFSEVEKWRDTNKHKLVSNLKVNNRGYFIFYKDGFIGLANE